MRVRFFSKEYNKIICEFTLIELPTNAQLNAAKQYVEENMQKWKGICGDKYAERDYADAYYELAETASYKYLKPKHNTLIHTFEI